MYIRGTSGVSDVLGVYQVCRVHFASISKKKDVLDVYQVCQVHFASISKMK